MNIGTNICRNYVVEYTQEKDKTIGYPRCYGTKDRDLCSCHGDVSKCNFYPEKRKENKTMNTAEMWLKAQEDGKTYTNEDLIYNKTIGFIWDDNSEAESLDESWTRTDVLSEFGWKLAENAMTKSEAEKKFNIKIVGE